MRVEIFDVEHGGCALVQADSGARMLIDCGSNPSTEWRPSLHLRGKGIPEVAMFVVTNYDDDHVRDLPNLRANTRIRSLLRNKTVSPEALVAMKRDGGMGNGIRELVTMMKEYTGGPFAVDWGSMSCKAFSNSYPHDFSDTNNLSLVIFLRAGHLHMVVPGDLERAGWEQLLRRQEFVDELRTVNVFVASHHGRENGCCEEVFKEVTPEVVILSDAGMQYETQETAPWYRSRSRGIDYKGNRRHVFTTRHDGKITIEASVTGTTIGTAH